MQILRMCAFVFAFHRLCPGLYGLDHAVKPAEDSIPFSVLTLNSAQLPFPLGLGEREERAKKLAHTIVNMERLPDVICLQEMFSDEAREIIEKKLKDQYPYSVHDKSFVLTKLDSGLAIFSRHPIHDKFQWIYSEHRGIEDFATKGVMGVQISVHSKRVLVFTTHLQTGGKWLLLNALDEGKPEATQIKADQVMEAYAFISKTREGAKAGYTFFTGDFNIRSDTELYHTMTQILFDAGDTHAKSCSAQSGTTWADNGLESKGNRIDYIWAFSLDLDVWGHSCIVDQFSPDITDHLAVLGNFYLI